MGRFDGFIPFPFGTIVFGAVAGFLLGSFLLAIAVGIVPALGLIGFGILVLGIIIFAHVAADGYREVFFLSIGVIIGVTLLTFVVGLADLDQFRQWFLN